MTRSKIADITQALRGMYPADGSPPQMPPGIQPARSLRCDGCRHWGPHEGSDDIRRCIHPAPEQRERLVQLHRAGVVGVGYDDEGDPTETWGDFDAQEFASPAPGESTKDERLGALAWSLTTRNGVSARTSQE